MARINAQERIHNMLSLERTLHDQGFALIAGVDEAGRGPLAGPVAAGAVIMPIDSPLLCVNDSKKMTEKRREEAYEAILSEAVAWHVALISPAEIDHINILQATRKAMMDAVLGLKIAPDHVVTDAMALPLAVPVTPIVKADANVYCVAAASILAKVTRDRAMIALDALYPGYGFSQHKGYGTAQHIDALHRLGPCPEHRQSFIGRIMERAQHAGA